MVKKEKDKITKFYILKIYDEAIHGVVQGEQTSEVVAGPFASFGEAIEYKMENYRKHGCVYYTVVEANSRPESTSKEYHFVDAKYEFTEE